MRRAACPPLPSSATPRTTTGRSAIGQRARRRLRGRRRHHMTSLTPARIQWPHRARRGVDTAVDTIATALARSNSTGSSRPCGGITGPATGCRQRSRPGWTSCWVDWARRVRRGRPARQAARPRFVGVSSSRGARRNGARAGEAGALGHAPQVEPAEDDLASSISTSTGAIDSLARQGSIVATAHTAGLRQEDRSPRALSRTCCCGRSLDRLFPTVCYVAGPSELAYQAQLGGVYRWLGVEAPLLYSRAGAALRRSACCVSLTAITCRSKACTSGRVGAQPSAQPAAARRRARARRNGRQMTGVAARCARPWADDPTLAGAVDTTLERAHAKSLNTKIIQATKRKRTLTASSSARALAFRPAIPGTDTQPPSSSTLRLTLGGGCSSGPLRPTSTTC